MSKAHAKYSPSATERWIECPASVEMEAQCPSPPESRAAIEGTRAHVCLELMIKNGESRMKETSAFLLRTNPPDMVEHALQTAIYLWKYRGKRRMESEKRVKLPHVDPNLWGTLDVTLIEHFGVLEIIDYKYGKYVPVEATENAQLLTYGTGEAHRLKYNFETVKLTIIQPRSPHPEGPVRSWSTPIETIFKWEDQLKRAISQSKMRKPPIKAGEHCFFCKAKAICPAFTPGATEGLRKRIVSNAMSRDLTPEQEQKRIVEYFGPAPRERARKPE